MKPSEQELNRAMAEAVGMHTSVCEGHTWELNEDGIRNDFAFSEGFHNGPMCTRCGYYYCEHCRSEKDISQKCQPIFPHFCRDRNTHAPIREAIIAAGVEVAFVTRLLALTKDTAGHRFGFYGRTFDFTFAEPRLVVEAALWALGKWQEEWDEEEATEHE